MNHFVQNWQKLSDTAVLLDQEIQQQEKVKSVLLYWDQLHQWIGYKEQVLFPYLQQYYPSKSGIIRSLKQDHQLLLTLANRVQTNNNDLPAARSLLSVTRHHLLLEKKQLIPLLAEMPQLPGVVPDFSRVSR